MLYMVEMDLPDRSRVIEWHAWYITHIQKLLTVDGYHGAQRFESLTPTPSPFLALHEVDGLEVFDSDQYHAVGGPKGTGEWQPLMTNWYRNLFAGLDTTPEISMTETLVVVEEGCDLPAELEQRTRWLSNAGLDRSAATRGLLILNDGESHGQLAKLDKLRVFKTLTEKLV